MKLETTIEPSLSLGNFWDEIYLGDLKKLPWLSNPYPIDLFQNFVNKLKGCKNLLDYGTGIGRFYPFLQETGANIMCLDASINALKICMGNYPDAIAIRSETPKRLEDNFFNGVLCWGVLHHIAPNMRQGFWSNLSDKIRKNGIILLGGWSSNDNEHKDQDRISSITNRPTWNIDTDLVKTTEQFKLEIIDEGQFPFVEAYTSKKRLFSYYLIQKN